MTTAKHRVCLRSFSFCLLLLTFAGCKQTPSEAVPVHRLEKVLFDTPADQLQTALHAHADEFNTPLLTLYPDEPDFMQQLDGFVADPSMRQVYRWVDSTFGDMQDFSHEMGGALAKARELYPAMRYDKIYTYISGTFNYDTRVVCNSHECLISLDQYVLPSAARYNYFGTPLYLVHQSHRQYLVADCMMAAAREYIAMPETTPTLLDYMVAEGKALWLAQQCLPHAHDSILLRYSSEQYDWVKHNEEHIWAYFLQNKLLFETDYMRFHNFIDEAPKTNAFRDSAPRTTNYIGLHIVSEYMKRSGATVEELFNETNSQQILNESNYRPKR